MKEHYDVAHILDFLKHDEKDSVIWSFAKQEGYTIVTNDEDFVNILSSKGWPPKIVLLKTGNQTNDYLFSKLVDRKEELELFIQNDKLGVLILA